MTGGGQETLRIRNGCGSVKALLYGQGCKAQRVATAADRGPVYRDRFCAVWTVRLRTFGWRAECVRHSSDIRLAARWAVFGAFLSYSLLGNEKMGLDNKTSEDVNEPKKPLADRWVSRREAIKLGIGGATSVAAAGATSFYFLRRAEGVSVAEVFKRDAPSGRLWRQWKDRGWAREARHYLKLGRNMQCRLCPNECLLEPEDRGRCRNRVNKDGAMYTMTYGNPCAFHVDPIEKKPLFHFLPATGVFSIATSGCSMRCLNCQNWDISQRSPEESKDPSGAPIRLNPARLTKLTRDDVNRSSMFPDDVVAIAEDFRCKSIAYTYSEPIAWFEYMIDTAKKARSKNIKNVWVTCGHINERPLVELCEYLDAANVDLKSFDDQTYKTLNSGTLQPILETLKRLKREGVWFEVTNLIVPTYTDNYDAIRRMCDWLFDNIGPDYPLHFSRFHPAHKLKNLPPTPLDFLAEAVSIAKSCGLHHVYVGNARGIVDSEATVCPNCHKKVLMRHIYFVEAVDIEDGKCNSCGMPIAGVWA